MSDRTEQRIIHDLRRASKEVLDQFKDCGDHYEYPGSMNAVEDLREAWRRAHAYWMDGVMK